MTKIPGTATETDACRFCGSTPLVRNGHDRSGTQRFLCRTCGRASRLHPEDNGWPQEYRVRVVNAYKKCGSLRNVSRQFHLSRNTVAAWVKASQASESAKAHQSV